MRDPFPPRSEAFAATCRRSRISLLILAMMAGLGVNACSTHLSFETQNQNADEEALVPPVYEGSVDFVDEDLLTDQIESENQDIRQIETTESASTAPVTDIEGRDPCYGAKQLNEACSAIELPRNSGSEQAAVPAEIRLNAIGAGVADPREFDADRTVDEIGRGQAVSETSLAVGESFLSPPEAPPVEPEHELEHDTLPDAAAVTFLNQ